MVEYFKRFMQWQNYVHYVLLAVIVFFAIRFFSYSFWKIAVALFIGDSIVHAIFWYIKKPYQWRD